MAPTRSKLTTSTVQNKRTILSISATKIYYLSILSYKGFKCVLFKEHYYIIISFGVPGEIRTHDPQIRNLVLYPTELRALLKNNRTYLIL